jgi:hypothetical protein
MTEGTLAQAHDGSRWYVSEDGMHARPEESNPELGWRDINDVRMERGVLWPVTEASDG